MSGFTGISGFLQPGEIVVINGEWMRATDVPGVLESLGTWERCRAVAGLRLRRARAWLVERSPWVRWRSGRCNPLGCPGSRCWRRGSLDGLCEEHARLADEWEARR